MLEKLLKLYRMAMAHDVRSPMPHLVGPPGVGKSTVAELAAQILGVNLHVINVARLSPLEVEGVQMPVTIEGEKQRLELLLATFWANLRPNDIVLFDEFLRGFPETYNAILDILTSRRVQDFVLPPVFIIGASNSVIAYDQALEDRLLHIPVADIRSDRSARQEIADIIAKQIGLLPTMATSVEMTDLLSTQVYPMYNILDFFKGVGAAAPAKSFGSSPRKLIGQAQLREVQAPELATLITENNRAAMKQGKIQYVILLNGSNVPAGYIERARKLVGNASLTQQQAINLQLNLELVELEELRKASRVPHTEEASTSDDDLFQ